MSDAVVKKVTIVGTGSWGLTLGKLLHENGCKIRFWTHSPEEAELLRTNSSYEAKLPGIQLPKDFQYSTNLAEVCAGAEFIVMAVPSAFVRNVSKQLGQLSMDGDTILVSLTKGITNDTLQRMSEVMLQEIPWLEDRCVVALSGPSHAEEVARRVVTAVVAACKDLTTAALVQETFSNDYFRVYSSEDIVGVELGGALKNVIAVASGVIDGLNQGDNTRGALMTRGLVEIARLGEAMGSDMRTFMGLTGMGDLITTCTSQHSRNRFVGEKIGRGEKLDDILAGMSMVAEGVPTCKSAVALAEKHGIEMPITQAVYNTLFGGADPRENILDLMQRALKVETE